MKYLNVLVFCGIMIALLGLQSCDSKMDSENTYAEKISEGCGDGICHITEVGDVCPIDCVVGVSVCGNGQCGETEDAATCPEDCESSTPTYMCGDQVCHIEELVSGSCVEDCVDGASICGDNNCGETESFQVCPEDCEETAEPVVVPCTHPDAGNYVVLNEVVPNLGWTGAFLADGSTVDFTMEKFHCSEEYEGYSSLVLVLGTGWCPACPDYLRMMGGIAQDLDDAGMMVIFMEAQDINGVPSTNQDAAEFLDVLISDAPGLRVGDGETEPRPETVIQSPIVEAYPAGFVVRKSDMMVIASQNASQYILPFNDMAAEPDADWSDLSGEGPNCGPEDQEIYEPNDDPAGAPVLEPGSFDGGICAPTYDFYRIEMEETWRLTLEFSHEQGDLDVHLWNFENEVPDFGTGSSTNSDNESFEHSGPGTVIIYGYNLATALYTLTLELVE